MATTQTSFLGIPDSVQGRINGRYYEQANAGAVFHAINPVAGVALVAVGTTPGFAIYNPTGNNRNLEIIRVALGLVSGTFVVGTVFYGVNTNASAAATTGTAVTALNGNLALTTNATGKVFTAATVPTAPTIFRPFAIKNVTAATGNDFQLVDDPDGTIVVSPGCTLSLHVIGTDTSPLWVPYVCWAEVQPR